MLQVTPTGSWGKDFHPHLPISRDELLADLLDCFREGADGVHLHVRDADGLESLEPTLVNEVCRQVRELAKSVGAEVEIGLTTGAWIEPHLASRIAMIREWEGVDCATVNLSEHGFATVMTTLADIGIGIDVGLWSPDEVDPLIQSGMLERAYRISIELDPDEPGSHDSDPLDTSRKINQLLDDANSTCPRLTHGSGEWTWPLVLDAFHRGHDTRVGFEDSISLPDGSIAASNAQLVAAAIELRSA